MTIHYSSKSKPVHFKNKSPDHMDQQLYTILMNGFTFNHTEHRMVRNHYFTPFLFKKKNSIKPQNMFCSNQLQWIFSYHSPFFKSPPQSLGSMAKQINETSLNLYAQRSFHIWKRQRENFTAIREALTSSASLWFLDYVIWGVAEI